MARKKKLKARPRESIHEIRAAGRESEGTLSPENSMNFRGTRRLPSQIASDLRRETSVSYDFDGRKNLGSPLFKPPATRIS